MPTVPHSDYLPDVSGPDTEPDYETEPDDQDQGAEDEYDEYQEANHPMD